MPFRDRAIPDLSQIEEPVVNVLITVDGKVPVFKRSNDRDSWYDLPGGKPEPEDDTISHTALRELMEETGMTGRVIHHEPVDIMPHPHIEGKFKVFMLCAHVSGEPYNRLEDEHDELLMLAPEEAIEKLGSRISPKAAEVLRAINDTPVLAGTAVSRRAYPPQGRC